MTVGVSLEKPPATQILAEPDFLQPANGNVPIGFSVVDRPTRRPTDLPPGESTVDETITGINQLNPAFVALDEIRKPTCQPVNIKKVLGKTSSAATFPVVEWFGFSIKNIGHLLKAYSASGVQGIIVKPSRGELSGKDRPEKDRSALDLLEVAKNLELFTWLGVVIRPEKRLDSKTTRSEYAEIAGQLELADFGITQFMLSVDPWSALTKAMATRDIVTPIIPSLLIYRGVYSLADLAGRHNVKISDDLRKGIIGAEPILDTDQREKARRNLLAKYTVALGREFVKKGALGLHINTNNQPELTAQITQAIRR